MAAALTFIDDGDYSQDALVALISGLADVDKDDDLSESEQEIYDDLIKMTADALVSLTLASSPPRETRLTSESLSRVMTKKE